MPTPTYTFAANTKIKSAEVNTNFSLLTQCLALSGGTMSGTLNSLSVVPTVDATYSLGSATLGFANLFLGSAAILNFNNGNVVLTHTSGVLTLGTGTLKITTPTNTTTSVVTIDGTQSLTNKTYEGMTLSGAKTLTLAGNLTTSGTSALTLTTTAATNITFPTSGTLQTTTGTPAGFVIASQATGDTLYASSNSAWSRLGKGNNGSLLQMGASIPLWTTATYPTTAGTSGNVLVSDGTNWSSAANPGSYRLLYSATGTSSLGAAGNWDTYALASQLSGLDQLYIRAVIIGTAGGTQLYHNTDTTVLSTAATNTSGTHGNIFHWDLSQGSLTTNIAVESTSYDGSDIAVGKQGIIATTTTFQGNWTVALRTDTGGASVFWHWEIYRKVGQ